MSVRKAFYHVVKLSKVNTSAPDISITDYFKEIYSKHTSANGYVRSLTHNLEDVTYTIDFIRFDSIMTVRIGKEKDHTNIVVRNSDFTVNPVINKRDASNKHLEVCGYLMLDLEYGIVGYLAGSSAPKVHALFEITNTIEKSYKLKLEGVMNKESIQLLAEPGSELSEINMIFKTPDIAALTQLGISKDTADSIAAFDSNEIRIVIKAEPRQKLSKDPSKIKQFINSLTKESSAIKNNTNCPGRTYKEGLKNYKFIDEFFYFNISITDSSKVDGKRVPRDIDEITADVFNKMYTEYIKKQKQILLLSNIQNGKK